MSNRHRATSFSTTAAVSGIGGHLRGFSSHDVGMNLYGTKPHLGITSRQDVLRSGITRREYEAALATGDLIRIDRSRVALRGTPDTLIDTARAGATLTCLSALAHHGTDTLPTRLLHVRRSEYCKRTRPLPERMCSCNLPAPPGDEIAPKIGRASCRERV